MAERTERLTQYILHPPSPYGCGLPPSLVERLQQQQEAQDAKAAPSAEGNLEPLADQTPSAPKVPASKPGTAPLPVLPLLPAPTLPAAAKDGEAAPETTQQKAGQERFADAL